MMIRLILFTETGFSKVEESVVLNMFGSQDISAALLFQAVIESVELEIFWGLLT